MEGIIKNLKIFHSTSYGIRHTKMGFTLVEIVVDIAVIALVAAAVLTA